MPKDEQGVWRCAWCDADYANDGHDRWCISTIDGGMTVDPSRVIVLPASTKLLAGDAPLPRPSP